MATFQHNFKVKNGLTVENAAGNDSEIVLKDNSSTALVVKQGSTNFLSFDTTNSAEKVVFSQAVDFGGQTITNLPTAFTVTDGSNSSAIAGGGTLTVQGTANEVEVAESSGTLTIGLPNDVTITGNLTVNGTTTQVNSTTVTVDDPIMTLGGDTAPASDDNKDRGVEFRWHNGSAAKVGFFGMDDTDNKFMYIPEASNSSEVMSGTLGGAKFGAVDVTGLTNSALTDNRITIAGTSGVLEDDANLTFDGSNLVIATTAAIQVPVGTTGERPSAVQGQLRYNTTDNSFEGYSGTAWGSLGGVKDGDGDTTIIAEDSAGADNDELDFKTAGTIRMTIGATGDISHGDSLNKFTVAAATGNTLIAGTLDVTNAVNLNSTATSSSSTTGALIVDGGVGVAENLNVGQLFKATGNAQFDGDLYAYGSLINLGNSSSDTVVFNARVNSDIVPNADSTHDLGTVSNRFAVAHIDDIKLNGFINGINNLNMDITAGAPGSAGEGKVFYDNTFDALAYYTGDTSQIIRIGQSTFQYVYNDTGATIGAGKAVRFSGGLTAGGMKVSLSDKSSTDVQHTIGLTFGSIANAGYGYVLIQGLYQNLDTSAFSVGAPLYVDTAGGLTSTSPVYPNFSVEVCKTTKSDASSGVVYVDMINNMAASFRTTGNARFDGNVVIGGNLEILGTSASTDVNSLNVEDPYVFLGSGDSIGTVNYSGSGLNDMSFSGLFQGPTSTVYYVKITATGTPDQFSWSKDNFSTTEASNVAITGADQTLDNGIKIKFQSTTGHTLNDVWSGTAAPANIDLGVVGFRNTGSSGVGFTQVGLFFDITDQKFRIFDEYDPALTGNVDTSDSSFSLGTLVADTMEATTFTGALNGTASTATEAQTIHTITRGSVNSTHYVNIVDSDDASMAVNQVYTDDGLQYNPSTNYLTVTGRVIADAIELTGSDGIFFEGSSSNTFETQLVVTNPSQDNVITLPDNTGTVALTSQLGGGAGADTGINAGNLLAVASGGLSDDDFLRIDGTSVEGLTVAETVTALGVLQNVIEDTSPQLGGNLDGQAFNITTTGRLNYKNSYANSSAFPNAGTYNGMFLVDASNGYPYFSHNAGWIRLAQTNEVIGDVIDDTSPQLGGNLDVNDKNILNNASSTIVHFGPAAVRDTGALINFNLNKGSSTSNVVVWESDYNAGGESHWHRYYSQNNGINGPIARFDFNGYDSAGNNHMYGLQKFYIKNHTDGKECGAYQIQLAKDDDVAGSGSTGLVSVININTADTNINIPGVNNGSFRIFGCDLYLQGNSSHGYPNLLLDTGTYDTAISATTGTAHRTITLPDASGTVLLAGTASSSADVQFDSFGVGTAASGTTGEIRATNDVTAFYSSDRNLKENIEVIADPLGKITAMRGVMFDWTDEHIEKRGGEDGFFVRKHDVGVIAQEVEAVLPEVVRERDDGTKAVDYQKIVALLIEGMKEQQEQIKTLTEQVNSLITNSSEK